ncbi:Hoc-like head decoration [Serratia phage 92A1]|nr:Hoc-like head decoration [Serratia phage 92A1]
MALQLVSSSKYIVGAPIAMTATNSAPEVDEFVQYEFKKDGVSVQKSDKAAYAKAKAALTDAGSWTVTGIKADDSEIESAAVVVTVEKQTMTLGITIEPTGKTIEVGESIAFKATVSGAPVGATLTYEWTVDGVAATANKAVDFTHKFTKTGTSKIACKVTAKAVDYTDATVNGSASVSVSEKAPEVEGCIRYIHPLDHRESAYIWAGWWVMREIEAAADKGIDWKKPDGTELKYKCDLKTLALMLDKYPNVEVQESRNGYIVDREMLELGIIY